MSKESKRVALRLVMRVWRRGGANEREDLFRVWPDLYLALEKLGHEDRKAAGGGDS